MKDCVAGVYTHGESRAHLPNSGIQQEVLPIDMVRPLMSVWRHPAWHDLCDGVVVVRGAARKADPLGAG
jgi:hypothetical protein